MRACGIAAYAQLFCSGNSAGTGPSYRMRRPSSVGCMLAHIGVGQPSQPSLVFKQHVQPGEPEKVPDTHALGT
jgi:hypothetical protein